MISGLLLALVVAWLVLVAEIGRDTNARHDDQAPTTAPEWNDR